jgi:hypothetical protein
MSKRAFTSTNQVIEALGGNAAVAALTGRWPGAVSNWRSLEHFPANTYVIMRKALEKLELEAPDWLWDMEPRPHRKPRRAKSVATLEAV